VRLQRLLWASDMSHNISNRIIDSSFSVINFTHLRNYKLEIAEEVYRSFFVLWYFLDWLVTCPKAFYVSFLLLGLWFHINPNSRKWTTGPIIFTKYLRQWQQACNHLSTVCLSPDSWRISTWRASLMELIVLCTYAAWTKLGRLKTLFLCHKKINISWKSRANLNKFPTCAWQVKMQNNRKPADNRKSIITSSNTYNFILHQINNSCNIRQHGTDIPTNNTKCMRHIIKNILLSLNQQRHL
jgi:hypothetical protein